MWNLVVGLHMSWSLWFWQIICICTWISSNILFEGAGSLNWIQIHYSFMTTNVHMKNMIIPPEIQENWFHIWNNTPGTLGISWATEIHWAIRLKILQKILYQKYWSENYLWIISYSSCVIIPIWCIKHCIIHTVLFTSNGNISLHVSNLWGN